MSKLFSILGLITFISVIACTTEPDGPKDKTAPVITLLSPSAADFYQDNLVISATAIDDEAVVVMQIYFDGTMIDSQPADGIDFTINTQQFEDGEHTIKIVAEDEAGNEASVEQTINLLNTFITLNLVVNNPEPNIEYFYYLLDEEGAVVDDAVHQVVSGLTQVKFSTPENHTLGKKYSLASFEHEGVRGIWPPTNRLSIVTGYSQGTYYETVGYPAVSSDIAVGYHIINLSNPLLVGYQTEINGYFPTVVNSIHLLLEKNNASAYIAIRPNLAQPPLYKIFSALNVGQSTIISPADFTTVMNGVTIPASVNSQYTFSFVYGVKTAGDYLSLKIAWAHITSTPREFQMYYPGNNFVEYFSGMEESFPDHTDLYQSIGQTPPTEFKRLNAQITGLNKSGGILTVQTTGTYDNIILSGGHQSTDGLSVNYVWSITLPENHSLTYKLPEVPQQLMDMFDYPASSEWNTNIGVTFNEYSGLNGYTDYFEKIYKNTRTTGVYGAWRSHSREWLARGSSFTPTGGRVSRPNSLKSPEFSLPYYHHRKGPF